MSDQVGGSATPLVSIVTTTYRTPAALLETSIKSALDQTLVSLEVIVVADGALDPAQSDVLERARRDPRLRVVGAARIGRARALNAGVETARAPLVAIQDADDASHPERLERQVAVLDERRDIDLLGSAVHRSTRRDASADWALPAMRGRAPGSAHRVEMLDLKLLVGNPLVHSSIIVRRSALEEIGGYSSDRRYQFDHDLYLRMREAGLGLARVPDELVLKRVHPDQVFEAGAPFAARLVSAWRLQVAHARREAFPLDAALVAAASVRLGARLARASLRRMKARR